MKSMFSRLVTLLFSLFTSAISSANDPPPELKSLMGDLERRSSVTYVNHLDPQQKLFYWKDTVQNENGYLEITADRRYVDLVNDLMRNARADSAKFKNAFDFGDRKPGVSETFYQSEFIESPFRANIFLKTVEGQPSMLTIWAYAKQGAKLFIVNEFLNANVRGTKGTLAYVRNSDTTKGIWKLTWLEDSLQFELYVNADHGVEASSVLAQCILDFANRLPKFYPEEVEAALSTIAR